MKITVVFCCLVASASLQAENNITSTARERYFDVVRASIEASAKVMPAEKYSFRLTPGQRTFAEWLVHSIERNYRDCAVLRSEPTQPGERQAASLTEKAEVSKALKASFDYCAAALETIDDQKAAASPRVSYAYLHVIVHSNEIYGNLVGYLRASGIVPPSTASRAEEKGKKK
jgi:DinB superfamily